MMRFYEDFTRCECGAATIEKKELLKADYKFTTSKAILYFIELENHKQTDYVCTSCKKVIHTIKAT